MPGGIHPLVQAAVSAMHPSYVHPTPFHLGSAPPSVPRRGQAMLPLWCAEQLQPLVHSERAAAYADVIDRLRKLAREPTSESLEAARSVAAGLGDEAADPASMAALAVTGAAHLVSQLRNAPRAARAACVRMMRLLDGPQKPGAPTQTAVLVALDQRLLLLEMAAGVRRRDRAAAERLVEIVFRGADGRGSPEVWVGRLGPDGPWGALVRRKGFHWVEGDRDHALATVPDGHFPAATAAALGS
jgi:hypothetical protein